MTEQAKDDGKAADLVRLWEEHIRHEFQTRSTDDTIATMVEDAYVDHVPVLTGGCGHAELREFYATHSSPKCRPGSRDHVFGPTTRVSADTFACLRAGARRAVIWRGDFR